MDTGQLKNGAIYDMDFNHEFLETEKYDAKHTYKYFKGYSPGVAVIGDKIVGIENRDGIANVRFHQADTLERIYFNIEDHRIKIGSSRMDFGSYSQDIIKVVMAHSERFYIRAERYEWLYDAIKKHTDWTEAEINNEKYELRSFVFVSFDEIKHCTARSSKTKASER
jgi:hypothetical protein